MTICTQQTQVSFIGAPVLKSARPSILAFLWPHFLGRINVVNIERAMIGKTARLTFTAKLFDYFQLALPVSRVLVRGVSVFIPIVFYAASRAKAIHARLTALLAFPAFSPSRSQITRLSAVFSSAVFDAVGVRFKRLFAMAAGNFNLGVFSHKQHYIKVNGICEPKYFDIACERIDNAYRQARMFA